MTIRFHKNDLPDLPNYEVAAVAIDTETLGLNPHRDRLCVVQISPGDGTADVIQIAPGQREAPNLVSLLSDRGITKLFHFGRFDIAVLYHAFGVMPEPVFCTKIASRLTRTYTDRHGLKDICAELLGVNLRKSSSPRTGAPTADAGAARLCRLRRALSAPVARGADGRLTRENRTRRSRRLLPLPADAREARPDGLGRGRHFRA